MEFLRSFLRRHLAGKPVVASPNAYLFIYLFIYLIAFTMITMLKKIREKNTVEQDTKTRDEGADTQQSEAPN